MRRRGIRLLFRRQGSDCHRPAISAYRRTRLHISPESVKLATEAAGPEGKPGEVLEKRIRVPDSWLRGFLQVQSSAVLPLDIFV